MTAVLFVAMNFSPYFSGEKTSSNEFAAQQIVTRVAVCVRMCVPIAENDVRVACCVARARPQSAK